MADYISCPFCGEGDYDLVGLKAHLLGENMFGEPCENFSATLTIEEERTLRQAKKDYEKNEGN